MKRLLYVIAGLLVLVAAVLYFIKIIPETVQTTSPGRTSIVSLGDSVAAGAGLENESSDLTGCNTSDAAYPVLLSNSTKHPLLQYACSGATVESGNNSLLSQFQKSKSQIAHSDVIVTAGANDINWLQTIQSCVQSNCATDANRAAINNNLQKLQIDLTTLLNQIQALKPHQVVVNTYYQLISPGDECLSNYGVTDQAISFIDDEEAKLNAVITNAATVSESTVVHVDFSGHLLCNTQPWIQGVSGYAPLHPTVAGQQQIAREDAQELVK